MQLWAMGFRKVLLCMMSIAFLATTSLGLHSHEEEGSDHASLSQTLDGHADSFEHDVYLASELSEAHIAEHLLHGDVDVESKVFLLTKSALPSLFLALAAFGFLIVLMSPRQMRLVLSDERPLRPPRRARWLPPSQAPPCPV